MAEIDLITDLAQNVYYTINKAENDDTGEDLTVFQNEFIRSFNLWRDEFETEAYWNQLRENDYELATIANTTTYSFTLPETYRTPVFNQNQELKFISDGTVIARFQLVNPSQRQVDDTLLRKNRATFLPSGTSGGGSIVLSRPPTAEEVGATIVLDVVKKMPDLTRDDATALDYMYSKQLATLGIAKNETLADLTKVSLSPSFAQKYANELQKAKMENAASNAIDEMRGNDYSYIGGVW